MEEKIDPVLEVQKVDIAVSAMNSALGILPIVGPLLAELVGYTIPNQRFDRLVKYSTQLEKKVEKIDNSVLKLALQDENFTDLMEESLRQAARSLSDERREYISSVIANSLTPEKKDFIESKYILKILGEINDIEVIWLRFYYCPLMNGDSEFRQRHEKVIKYERAHIQSPQITVDKEALQKNYKTHLVELGLLKPIYASTKITSTIEIPVFDTFAKAPKIQNYEISSFGKLLIRQIGLDYDYQANFPK